MNLEEILSELQNSGARLRVVDNRLLCDFPKGTIDKKLRLALTLNKEAITDFVKNTTLLSSVKNIDIPRYKGQKSALPLTFSQEQLWLVQEMEGPGSNYNLVASFQLEGALDKEILITSFQTLFDRHEAFRTSFSNENGIPTQKILPDIIFTLDEIQIDPELINSTLDKHANHCFDLSKAPLIKVKLIKLDSQTHVISINMHHIISDGWSLVLMTNELNQIYNQLGSGKPASFTLEDNSLIDYADYAVWQKEFYDLQNPSSQLQGMLKFWRDYLNYAPREIILPYDMEYDSQKNTTGGQASYLFSPEKTHQLGTFAKKNKTTLFNVMLTAINILLYKWTGQSDLVVGTVVSGRSEGNTDSIIGCLINFLALRNRMNNIPIVDLLELTKVSTNRAFSNQQCPFSAVVSQLNFTRSNARSPLYNVVFRLQNVPDAKLEMQDVRITDISRPSESAQMDLIFEAIEHENGIRLNIEYDKNLFHLATANALIDNWQKILSQIALFFESSIEHLDLSDELIQQKNKSRDNIIKLNIAATFTAEPLQEALQYWSHRFHKKLEIKFAQYNHVFQELVQPNSMFNSTEGATNIILLRWQDWFGQKAGNAAAQLKRNGGEFLHALEASANSSNAPYIVQLCPLDEQWQKDSEINSICADLENQLRKLQTNRSTLIILSHQELTQTFPLSTYDDVQTNNLAHMPYSELGYTALASMLFRQYMAIKSKPHKVITLDCDNTLWGGICAEVGPMNVVLSQPYLMFQQRMVNLLNNGFLLCLCSKNNLDDVKSVFEQNNNMVLKWENIVASRINWERKSTNLDSLAQELDLDTDSFVFIDDDPVQCHDIRSHCPGTLVLQIPTRDTDIPQWLRHIWAFDHSSTRNIGKERTVFYRENKKRKRSEKLYNSLTEFIDSLNLEISFQPLDTKNISRATELSQRTNQFNNSTVRYTESELGEKIKNKSLQGFTVTLSDRFGDYGIIGLALYTKQQDKLLVQKFLLSCRALGRAVEYQMVQYLGKLCETMQCDEVRIKFFTTDKNTPLKLFLKHLGLNDSENIVTLSVKQAIGCRMSDDPVGADGDADSHKSISIDPGEHNEILVKIVEELNDVQSIYNAIQASQCNSKPIIEESKFSNELEKEILTLFCEQLRTDKLSLHDDFFAIGGNSLQAVKIISRVNRRFQLNLVMRDIFQNASAYDFCKFLANQLECVNIREDSIQQKQTITKRPDGENSLSFQQKRLWIVDQMEPGGTQYNMSVALKINGNLNQKALEDSIRTVIERHEILRTIYFEHEQVPFQYVQDSFQFTLNYVDLSNDLGKENSDIAFDDIYAEQKQMAFDLSSDLMLRAKLVKLGPDEHIITVIIHHIACDGWSLGILVEELSSLYSAFVKGQDNNLPALEIQYADYAYWENKILQSDELKIQLGYWKKKLENLPLIHQLPLDNTRPGIRLYRGSSLNHVLDSTCLEKIHRLTRKQDVTTYMFLQAVYVSLLYKLSGSDEIVIGSPVANRHMIEVEHLVGFFVNNLVLRQKCNGDQTFTELLKEISMNNISALENQQVPYELLVKELNPIRVSAYNPLFQICFSYQNNEREEFQLEGLELKVKEDINITARFDLILNVIENKQSIELTWNYDVELFSENTIRSFNRLFQSILAKVLNEPNLPMSELN